MAFSATGVGGVAPVLVPLVFGVEIFWNQITYTVAVPDVVLACWIVRVAGLDPVVTMPVIKTVPSTADVITLPVAVLNRWILSASTSEPFVDNIPTSTLAPDVEVKLIPYLIPPVPSLLTVISAWI